MHRSRLFLMNICFFDLALWVSPGLRLYSKYGHLVAILITRNSIGVEWTSVIANRWLIYDLYLSVLGSVCFNGGSLLLKKRWRADRAFSLPPRSRYLHRHRHTWPLIWTRQCLNSERSGSQIASFRALQFFFVLYLRIL